MSQKELSYFKNYCRSSRLTGYEKNEAVNILKLDVSYLNYVTQNEISIEDLNNHGQRRVGFV